MNIINWNTGRRYDSLGQTMSAWHDEENKKIFFVDGSRGINEIIDAVYLSDGASIKDYVMRVYDMDTVSRRATMDNDGEEWIVLDKINEVNKQYRETLG